MKPVYVKSGTNIDFDVGNSDKDTRFRSTVFRPCISKISSTCLENAAENLDIAIPMCNLLEDSENYSMTLGSLWNYYKDEIGDEDDEDDASEGKSFYYQTKIMRKAEVRPPQQAQPLTNLDYLGHCNHHKHKCHL